MSRSSIRGGELLIFLGALFLFWQYPPWENFSPFARADLIIYGGIGLLLCFMVALVSRWFILDEIVHIIALALGAALITLVATNISWMEWDDFSFFDFGGPFSQERTDAYTQKLNSARPAIQVNVVNGRVHLETAARPDYEVRVRTRVHGWHEDRLKELLQKFHPVPQLRADGFSLIQDLPPEVRRGWNSVKTDVDIILPQSATYKVTLASTNGPLTLENLTAYEVQLETTNGAIRVDEIKAQTVTLRSTNGSLQGQLNVASLTASTTNGRVDLGLVPMASGQYEIRTTNGSIDLHLPGGGIGYSIEADVNNGRVDVKLPGFQAQDQSRRHVRGQTANFTTSAIQQRIRAYTSNGSIEIREK